MHATPLLADKLPSLLAHKPAAAPLIALTEAEQAALIALLGSEKGELECIERRVCIVLLAARGWRNQQIANRLAISNNQVARWLTSTSARTVLIATAELA